MRLTDQTKHDIHHQTYALYQKLLKRHRQLILSALPEGGFLTQMQDALPLSQGDLKMKVPLFFSPGGKEGTNRTFVPHLALTQANQAALGTVCTRDNSPACSTRLKTWEFFDNKSSRNY